LPVPIAQTGAADTLTPPFLRVELRVSWFEAGAERSVTRTLFAVDEDAASKLAATGVLNKAASESERP
jgi:hypothetical protein